MFSCGHSGIQDGPSDLRNVDPSALFPRFFAFFGKLNAFGAFEQRPAERLILDDVAQKKFPLDFEGIVVGLIRCNLLPAVVEVDRAVDVGIPYRPRRGGVRLHPAVAQAGDGAALGSIDLQHQQIVAADAEAPTGVDVRDDAAGQFERGVGGVVGGAVVGVAVFVPTLVDVRCPEAGDGLDFAEKIVEHVAEVAEHVEDDAPAVFLAIVPRRALGGNRIAFEDPVAELAAHGKNPAEEAAVDQQLQFQQSRQPELVLHDAVLHARLLWRADRVPAPRRWLSPWVFRNRCACRRQWPS